MRMRRVLPIAALIACVGIVAWAAVERATFVLTNGDRVNGTVVYHGGRAENLIDGNLNLGDINGAAGKEQSFAENQVAVIDFSGGGQPPTDELEQVPARGHFLVLKDGTTNLGHFVNMIHGDTLIWRNQAGQEQRYALGDVSRIYLNPESARIAYNYTGPAAVGTTGQAVPAGAVRVEANRQWNSTGVSVKKGDRVAFRTSGQIKWGEGGTQTAGPDGNPSEQRASYPVPGMSVGALIGKVDGSAPFPIGSNAQPIVMPATGIVMLGVNDDQVGDNAGYFSVVVTKR